MPISARYGVLKRQPEDVIYVDGVVDVAKSNLSVSVVLRLCSAIPSQYVRRIPVSCVIVDTESYQPCGTYLCLSYVHPPIRHVAARASSDPDELSLTYRDVTLLWEE